MRGQKIAGTTASYVDEEDEVTYLSSQQIWDMLTHLIWVTMRPLSAQSTLTMDVLFVLIGATSDQRRKITKLNPDKCLDYTYRLLFVPSEKALKECIFTLGTERSVLQWFIHSYLEGKYNPNMLPTSKDTPVYEGDRLHEYVHDFYELYAEFRQKVAKRFIRLSNSQAAKNQWVRSQFGLHSDLEDNQNNYFLAVLRGVDKFYPSRGTLAGYLKPWLTHAAGSQFTLYHGEAFNLSRPVRKAVHEGTLTLTNKSYNLDDAIEIPIDEVDSDESQYLEKIGALERSGQLNLLLVLNGFPTLFLPNIGNRINDSELTETPLPPTWSAPKVELDDLPVLHPLSRSSRKDTDNQLRRKRILSNRKQ